MTFLSNTPPTNQNDFQLISAVTPFLFPLRYPLRKNTYSDRSSTQVGWQQDYNKK
ncbi:hypothetical protein PMCN01_0883 [Pasteurella multocida subsp. multocida HB01]|nr:hypothetical protein Pmu_09580 [Pasteurella multocida 36950]AFF24193.1 hypothetical protein PMCN06_0949 [Pasteurella multocida subsp. multocida str. HN06]AHE64345.1 hypothetical protein PMCN03_0890 [Pasteurella multocida subsp. multocida str. HB03]ANJ90111.1 hypothetical protein PMCN01_0883 [Pasteurella multocida subsp. multocida HB01]APW55477.1 hypothetical protein PMCN07_0893 [Pasteurella multocida subsp. multocida str. HN07]